MAKAVKRESFHQRNLNLVLQQVINGAPISRIDIARNLKMNKSSITTLYNEVVQQGYLKEIGIGSASKSGGRKPILVALNEKYGYTISVDLGYRHLHVMTNYLDGTIVGYARIETGPRNITAIMKLIDQQIDQAIATVTSEHGLLGIAFSIHGIVDQTQIINSPFLNMADVDLYQRYTDKYRVPVVLENEANLSAVFERDFNDAQQKNNIICVSIHKGIGAGIILNRQLYHGYKGAAGEIGRSLMFSTDPQKNQYDYDKVENFCSEDAILNTVAQQKQLSQLTREDLVQLVAKDDQIVQNVLDLFITSIARIIFNASVSFAPEDIYLNSPLVEALPATFKAIKATTSELGMIPQLHLTAQRYGYVTLLGACSLITHHVLGLDGYDLRFTTPAQA